jgi:nitroimidazol reductase NimA-like FMN-containing flavoprotein (pyridoxamine 5'-phosphate oxidase superfamily)
MSELTKTDRTTVRRRAQRGHYDRATVNAILDEAMVCHVGLVSDGAPLVLPTGYGRMGDSLVLHGSSINAMLGTLAGGVDACVTVTLLDGLVLARAAFRHSMNYRSVVLFGKATEIIDRAEKLRALEALTDHLIPGRWAEARWPTDEELDKTSVLLFPIDEASAKIRSGPPLDVDEDLAHPAWAGVLPVALHFDEASPDPKLDANKAVPAYLQGYQRGG